MLATLIAALLTLQATLASKELVAINTPIAYAATIPLGNPPETKLEPALVPICGCESAGSATARPVQYGPDGKVLRGTINPKDIGMCQINEYWNGAQAKRLGFDIKTTEGNIRMANWLYAQHGTRDWSSSRACWDHLVKR